ncbi:MAG: lipopolysaccharide heptosyltransferase II [Proteobacteria bacterium]|nr:lipopolysaccharide heptosyltransferase II [Pseudomonadota bacterium]
MTGKTIVYLPNWLGDMVMAIPFLNSLRASLNGDLWGIGKANAIHIYNGLGIFDRFMPLESRGPIPLLDMITLVKDLDFERGIALPHSFRSALLFYLARINERIGYPRNKRGFMLTQHVAEGNILEPTVEHYLKIIDALGGKRLSDTPALCVTEDEEHKFDQSNMDINKPYVAFIVGAQYGPSKCWPPGHFSKLADMIAENYGMKVYVLPGKGEEDLAREIYNETERKEFIVIKPMGIRELKVCLSRASVVVSNDTGPRHISAALSVPTIVLLGPMDERYTQYPNNYTYQISENIPCRPCNNKKCNKNHECLKDISPKEVFLKLGEIIEKRQQSEETKAGRENR